MARLTRTWNVMAAMGTLGALLAGGGCLASDAADPSLSQSALHAGDASDAYAAGDSDAPPSQASDSTGGVDADSAAPPQGGLHDCVIALVDCLFSEPQAVCEARFEACYAPCGGFTSPPPASVDPAACDHQLEECLGASPADPEGCFTDLDACMNASAGAPPAPEASDPIRACELERDLCVQQQPTPPSDCFAHFDACVEATAGPPGPDPDAEARAACEQAADACFTAAPDGAQGTIACFEALDACLADAGVPNDAAPSHPDPAACEQARDACLASGAAPDACDATLAACLAE